MDKPIIKYVVAGFGPRSGAAKYLFDGCALSRLHSQPLIAFMLARTRAKARDYILECNIDCGLQKWDKR